MGSFPSQPLALTYLATLNATAYWIDGEIHTKVVDEERDFVLATFRLKFAVQNARQAVTGICDDAILITDSSRPKIIAIKSKVVSRREEPLGP
jgi:hypothetical protein